MAQDFMATHEGVPHELPGAERRLRLLLLSPDFPPTVGGIQLLLHRLVTNLEEADARIVTLGAVGADSFDANSSLDVKRVGQKRVGRNRAVTVRLNLAAVLQGFRFRPNVVVSGLTVTAPAAAFLRVACGAKVVQYLHGEELRYRSRLARFAVRRADAVIAVSRHTMGMAIEAGCDPKRLHVVHPGVDVPATIDREPADRPTVLTVSRLSERYKGHDLIIRALPLVRERVPGVEWVVVGDGPLRAELEQQARSEGVADAVRFVGNVTDRERDQWFSSAHLFVMPSRLPDGISGGEGFGIVYLEAGARGLPVIGAAVGGALDAVVDGETGRLVSPTDHRMLAEAISELLLDRDLAARLGAAGAKRARELDWKRHARAVEGLMRELLTETENHR